MVNFDHLSLIYMKMTKMLRVASATALGRATQGMSELQTIIKATGAVRHCALCSTLQGVLLFSFTICEIVPCSVLSASDKR